MIRERRARVWLWLAHMADLEADDALYSYPRPDGWEELVEQLDESRLACEAKADSIDPRCSKGDLWRWVYDTFHAEGGVHADPPTSYDHKHDRAEPGEEEHHGETEGHGCGRGDGARAEGGEVREDQDAEGGEDSEDSEDESAEAGSLES